VSRTSLSGDFTLEVSVKLIEGSQANPDFDLGGFSIFVNPPGMDSLKLNINEDSITTGFGENETLVGSNTDGFHQFRVAYVESDEMYWVWKDGVLILGTSINPGGGFPEIRHQSLWVADFFSEIIRPTLAVIGKSITFA
jgi:hypothetical protein